MRSEPMAKPLPVARRGVTERVQFVGAFANVVFNVRRHFSDTTSVVRNWTVRVSRERDTKRGQHTSGGDGDAIQATNGVGRKNRQDDDNRRREDGDHTNAQTLDDDSRGATGRTGVRDGSYRSVRVRRAVFRGFTD